ncbi:MAG: TMEM175 family protein [Lactobacillales bacterium]|jgi:uncharacterized membrane protein|nr:TMEM175 family protein [Lactobacillales bacterium]
MERNKDRNEIIKEEFLLAHPEYAGKSNEELEASIRGRSESDREKVMFRLKEHLEVFGDAIIAIIITIMVLEIPLPVDGTSYPEFVSSIGIFLVSFFIIAEFWLDHHHLYDGVEKITDKIMFIDFCFMAVLALIPLFTKYMMVVDDWVSVVNYGIIYLLASIMISLLRHYITMIRLAKMPQSLRSYVVFSRFRLAGLIILNVAIMVFAYFQPGIAHWLYVVLPITNLLITALRDENANWLHKPKLIKLPSKEDALKNLLNDKKDKA